MDLLRAVDNTQIRTDLPSFRPGDTVRVHVKIKEGEKFVLYRIPRKPFVL